MGKNEKSRGDGISLLGAWTVEDLKRFVGVKIFEVCISFCPRWADGNLDVLFATLAAERVRFALKSQCYSRIGQGRG